MSQPDQCIDAACFDHEIIQAADMQIERTPQLAQIATACGRKPDGNVLGLNHCVALTLTSPAKSKQLLSPYQNSAA